MPSIVPEYLRKGELRFEILSRGESPVPDVRGLRSQFREVQGLSQSWLDTLDLEFELQVCRERIDELSGEVDLLTAAPSGSARVSLLTQALHWRGRLEVLAQAPTLSAADKAWVEERVLELGSLLVSLSQAGAVKAAVERIEGGLEGGLAAPSGQSAAPKDPGAVSMAAPTLEIPAGVSLKVPQWELGGGEPPKLLGPVSNLNFGALSPSFARLPHPLSAMLQGMSAVDGLQVEGLLDFLVQVLRMREFPGMSDRALMEIILPFCLRPLSDRVLDCLRRQAPFDVLHSEVLNFFVPFRVMETLRLQRILRPQGISESLSHYVSDVRMVSQVLRADISETHLVDMILQGLNPEERSRLVFAPRPSSFTDLERLIILSRSVQDGDLQRSQAVGHLPQPEPRPAVMMPGRPGAANPRGNQHSVVCFGCGQPGHMRSRCPKNNKPPN